MSRPAAWELVGFLEAFDEWVDQEQPPTALRAAVLAWIFTRAEDPYSGVTREPAFDNLWFGRIPMAQRGWDSVVCSFWVIEQQHVVRCDRFATQSFPV